MNKRFRSAPVSLIVAIVMVACTSTNTGSGIQRPTANEVATVVALTLQAVTPDVAVASTNTSVPEVSTSLLPHSLYFLGNDSQAITQIYRMERDGETKTQLTFEPISVVEYDVSMANGSVAYILNNQLLLVNADGANRKVLVDGGPRENNPWVSHPVFSPDGLTLAYAHNGLNLYSVSTGVSNLVIEDRPLGGSLPLETYSPEKYSPDGTKLIIHLLYSDHSSIAIYYPASNSLVRLICGEAALTCDASWFYSDIEWLADSSSVYAAASTPTSTYADNNLWRVDAATGAVTTLTPAGTSDGTVNFSDEPYLAPDNQFYFFFGIYKVDSGFYEPPFLELVRSAPDGVTDRTVLRDENFVLMREALWAPDASFVIVASSPGENLDLAGGVLELYPTDGQKEIVWLAPYGEQMKWGP
jgi:hypothetical protein